MRREAGGAAVARDERRVADLGDGLLVLHAALFVALFAAEIVLAFQDQVRLFARPPLLFALMLLPIMARVHVPDLTRHGLRHTMALCRDHRHLLLPFLGLVALSLATSILPGAGLEDEGKALTILAYRFAMFVAGIEAVLVLGRDGWRPVLLLTLALLVGSVFYDMAHPGTFSAVESRPAGFQNNPNLSAVSLIMLTSMVVRYDRIRALDAAVILASLVAVFATLSRSGMALFGVFLINYLYHVGSRSRLQQLILVPLVLVAGFLVVQVVISTMTGEFDVFQTENAQRRLSTLSLQNDAVYSTDEVRLSLVPLYLQLIDEKLFFGHGTGFSSTLPMGPHNIYLDFWVNNGLVGLVLYVWFVLGLLCLTWARRFAPGLTFAQVAILAGFVSHDIIQMAAFLVLAGFAAGASWLGVLPTRVDHPRRASPAARPAVP